MRKILKMIGLIQTFHDERAADLDSLKNVIEHIPEEAGLDHNFVSMVQSEYDKAIKYMKATGRIKISE